MKIALIYGAWSLSFRGGYTFADLRNDPRGLSGSEMAYVRLAELLSADHEVELYTIATDAWDGHTVKSLEQLEEIDETFDAAIVINEPDLLRRTKAKLKVVYHLINSFEFLVGPPDHVDLWLSPSEPHRQMILGQEHVVGEIQGATPGKWTPNLENWKTLLLGCDLPDLSSVAKVPGRVIYCSSPDRGLHWLLQEWPAIRKAAPKAHLKIFYRLQPWLDQWASIGYYAPIEGMRRRAQYIGDALRRLRGHGVEVVDSVSRNQIQRELLEAEVLAYPADTVRWTEGFSCSLLEGCASMACPVTTDVDALGEIYGGSIPTIPRKQIGLWRDTVIDALTDESFRGAINKRGRELAETMTWDLTAKGLVSAIEEAAC